MKKNSTAAFPPGQSASLTSVWDTVRNARLMIGRTTYRVHINQPTLLDGTILYSRKPKFLIYFILKPDLLKSLCQLSTFVVSLGLAFGGCTSSPSPPPYLFYPTGVCSVIAFCYCVLCFRASPSLDISIAAGSMSYTSFFLPLFLLSVSVCLSGSYLFRSGQLIIQFFFSFIIDDTYEICYRCWE